MPSHFFALSAKLVEPGILFSFCSCSSSSAFGFEDEYDSKRISRSRTESGIAKRLHCPPSESQCLPGGRSCCFQVPGFRIFENRPSSIKAPTLSMSGASDRSCSKRGDTERINS